jgi:Tfp pilus assembly protein FimT
MRKHEKGFSVMEILLVLALITVMLLIAIPLFSRLIKNYRVQTSATQLAVQMRFARNAAVKQKLKHRIVIDEGTSTYKVEKETDFDSGTFEVIENMDFNLPEGVTINETSDDGPITFNSRGFTEGNASYNIILDTWIPSLSRSVSVTYTVRVTPVGNVSTTRTET